MRFVRIRIRGIIGFSGFLRRISSARKRLSIFGLAKSASLANLGEDWTLFATFAPRPVIPAKAGIQRSPTKLAA